MMAILTVLLTMHRSYSFRIIAVLTTQKPTKPKRRPDRRILAAAIISAGVLSSGLAITYLVQDENWQVVLSDLQFPLISLFVSAFLYYVSRQPAVRAAGAVASWRIFALGILLTGIGDSIWAVLELSQKTLPFPSIADVAYIGYYVAFYIGMLSYPKKRLNKIDILKSSLESGTIMFGGVLALLYFMVIPVYQSIRPEPLLTQVLTLAYPIGDILLFSTSVILLYLHPKEVNRFPLLILAISSVIYCAADTVYSMQTLQDTYVSGQLLDNVWLLAYVLYAWAGLIQLVFPHASPQTVESSSRAGRIPFLNQWESYLPYLWLIGVFSLLIPSYYETIPWRFETLVAIIGIMIAMIMVRQILAVNENSRLNQKLGDANRLLRSKSTELVFTNQELQVQINAHQVARDRLSFEATHDQLTGLPNRNFLLNFLEPEIEKARADPMNNSAVMFLDCDQFKLINDSLGHLAGDTMLIQVAQRIRICLRSNDMVARLGGDEFIVYLPETNGMPGIIRVADRILEELRKPFSLTDQRVFLSASIGIVDHLSRYENPIDILRDADIAMYKAKELGKARYVFFNMAIGEEAYQRMEVERDLRQAIENQQFELYYQPVINLEDESLAGFEALLRWNHPRRGLLAPAEFIPLAEQTGLIRPMGKWVLATASAQFAAWIQAGLTLPDWFVSVNVSSNEFLDPAFAEGVADCLAQTGLKCCNLHLEITKSVFLADSEAARQTFAQLTALGVECMLDDFGTGYSSLGYLHAFPIHTIKIDRTFVWSIDTAQQQDMIGAIMSVAKGLGLKTVAEGIETVSQLTLLKQFGCRLGQGFLFYRPLPADQAEEFTAGPGPW